MPALPGWAQATLEKIVEPFAAVFDWDDANTRHLAPYAVSRDEAEQCYRNDPLIIEEQYLGGELRYLALGETDGARRLAFVFTVRGPRVRFITAYPMSGPQQEQYEKDETMSEEPVPSFTNEEKEAAWWDAHPEVLAQRFQSVGSRGVFTG